MTLTRTPDWEATVPFTGMSGAGLPDPAAADRYAPAPTGPMPAAFDRLGAALGDALARDPDWAPKFGNLPCGHCGAALDADPAEILYRTHVIGHLNWLARDAGWIHDVDLIWTCPQCQDGDEWKARQGQMDVRWPGPPDAQAPPRTDCPRHDLAADAAEFAAACCTCPAVRLAVDVMLVSERYLGSGRGRHRAGTS